jgi:hypothetical protein
LCGPSFDIRMYVFPHPLSKLPCCATNQLSSKKKIFYFLALQRRSASLGSSSRHSSCVCVRRRPSRRLHHLMPHNNGGRLNLSSFVCDKLGSAAIKMPFCAFSLAHTKAQDDPPPFQKGRIWLKKDKTRKGRPSHKRTEKDDDQGPKGRQRKAPQGWRGSNCR